MKQLSALVLSTLLWSATSVAQEIKDIPQGEDVIAPVAKGVPAPFTGQLFDANTALRWANWLRQYQAQVEAVERKERALCQSELSYENDLNRLDVEEQQTLNADLKKRLLRVETVKSQAEYDRDHPQWYSTVWFGLIVGVVGTSGLVFLGSQTF